MNKQEAQETSDYKYWFHWPNPKALPKGLEFWCDVSGKWKKAIHENPRYISNYNLYRWKRSEQI